MKHLEKGATEIPVEIDEKTVLTRLDVSERQRRNLIAGGTLNLVRRELKK
jgi:aconitate hydratase